MNKKKQRAIEIIALLKTHRFLGIQDLADCLGTSHMTIRRDVRQLDLDQLVDIVPGGVMLKESLYSDDKNYPYSLITESCLFQLEKSKIGIKAVELLEDGDFITIDSGTTTEYLARCIPEEKKLSILCYTLNVLFEIYKKKNCNIIFPGGQYQENTMLFQSPEGLQMIQRHRTQKAFIGATGFSDTLGVTCSNIGEPGIKQAVMGSSLKKILMIDSSKFGLVRPCYFAEPDDFDTIITDTNIPEKYRTYIENLGIELIIV
ncbi:MAG: DeoR/GlpR family DNA-binding transcription regulator [Sphaerochaeta sp.]|nr:DeoR/GlpR family DNA-binding transcription regulator [Sphaerochaeta sp.]